MSLQEQIDALPEWPERESDVAPFDVAEYSALRKDAERYRWLRTQHANIRLGMVHVAGVSALTSSGLDTAIDAAMEGQ